MKKEKFDVIIVGGSYSGLSAAMALGRALRKTLVIDAGQPANRFTPHSHNFITHDGKAPAEIAALAKEQVQQYKTVVFKNGFAVKVEKNGDEFIVALGSGEEYRTRKIILATGIIDLMLDIPGFRECWGKSLLHCPYCHGYEVRNTPTGILGNGDYAYEFASLIFNWTKDLKVYTNGKSTMSDEQRQKLSEHKIIVIETIIKEIVHNDGIINHLVLDNSEVHKINALYTRPPFIQHSELSNQLGCELTPEGYIKVDQSQRSNVPGVFACGDNITKMRTVSNAVSLGTTAGMMVNKELILEDFG